MQRIITIVLITTIILSVSLFAQPVGDIYICGTTWYETQHHGNVGRMVQVDNDDWSQMVWTNGLDIGSSNRHVYYQGLDNAGILQFTNPELGVRVNQLSRGGFATITIGFDGRAFPCFHQSSNSPTANAHTAIAWDFLPQVGAFQTVELPWVYQGGQDLEIIWPKSAIDIEGRIHIVSIENGESLDKDLYYGWAEYDNGTSTIRTCHEQEFIDSTRLITTDVAASPVSNRVAVGWMKFTSWIPPDYNLNDLLVVVSEDGCTWDWDNPVNITNWIPPDLSLLPDTLAANKDTLRCHDDMCLFFDNNDILHVVFSVKHYYAIQQVYPDYNGFIYHWDELTEEFTVVANGWFDNVFFHPGIPGSYAARPSISIDNETDEIYCMYNRSVVPADTILIYPHQWAEVSDTSVAGFPNAEIWITKSVDNGRSWAEGTNVTNTYSPAAFPGDCLSEVYPSMAVKNANDRLDVFYELDKDAGDVGQGQGTITLNDMICQRIPMDEISSEPVLPYHPMHVDSIPGQMSIELIPFILPVQIPAGGGTFDYTIIIENTGIMQNAVDIWTLVTLPDGNIYGPIILVERTIPMFTTISRDLTQRVPAVAPSGTYYYTAYIGQYPSIVLSADRFEFVKLAGE